ncbi:hypothetical protein ACOMHN_007897 [Nucella lapillus]
MSVVEAGPAGRQRSAQRSVPAGLTMRELVMAIAAMFRAVGCDLVAGAVVVSSPVVDYVHSWQLANTGGSRVDPGPNLYMVLRPTHRGLQRWTSMPSPQRLSLQNSTLPVEHQWEKA